MLRPAKIFLDLTSAEAVKMSLKSNFLQTSLSIDKIAKAFSLFCVIV